MTANTSGQEDYRLPEFVRTRSGVIFDPRPDQWRYADDNSLVSVNFHLCPPASARIRFALKKILIAYAEEKAPRTVLTTWTLLLRFLRVIVSWRKTTIDEITEIDLMNFKAYKNLGTRSGESVLSQLTGAFQQWHALRLPGFSDSTADMLKGMRLAGATTGEAVRTRDPIKGPLTDIELQGLIQANENAFATGQLDEDVYLATWLIIALGLRNIQLAALKVCDISCEHDDYGLPQYYLSVPRAKQPDKSVREEFKRRKLVPEIGAPLFEYARRVQADFENRLRDPTQAPLFPMSRASLGGAEGFQFHQTAANLHSNLLYCWSGLDVFSERTGKKIRPSSRRLRYTLGTRAAEESYPIDVIAEMLDHSTLQTAEVYIASTAEIAIRIDGAVAKDLAPLARAFAGTVARDASKSPHRDGPATRIIDMRVDRYKPMGECGTGTKCALLKPVACYTCSSFQPWLDGPHEKLLEILVAERQRLLVETDERIASINDRTILAVEQVIQVCRTESAERALHNG
jgi:integrase